MAGAAVGSNIAVFLFLSVGAIALFSFVAVASWSDNRRREREAYYRSETVKKVAEMQGGGATSALEVLREQERIANRRRQEGLRLGGLITACVGIGVMVLLKAIEKDEALYLAGLIPFLIGAAMLVYSYVLAPKE